MILLGVYSLLSVLLIFFSKNLDGLLVSWNYSWTFSKVIPYLLLIIFGFLIARKLKMFFLLPSKILRKILFWGVLVFPFAIGFIFNPIYQGDFSKEGTTFAKSESPRELTKYDLTVLSIPDCPYCHEAVGTINMIQARNPEMKIKFIVCSSEKRQLDPYKAKLHSAIKVVLAKDIKAISEINKGSFPSFITPQENEIYIWSNDSFGVRAKDFLENSIKN